MSDTSFDDIHLELDDTGSSINAFDSEPDIPGSEFDELDGLDLDLNLDTVSLDLNSTGFHSDIESDFSRSQTPVPSSPPTPLPPQLPQDKPTFIKSVIDILTARLSMADDAKRAAQKADPVERAAVSLRAAAAGGYTALVELLIKKYRGQYPAEFEERILNGQDKDGAGPLYHAAFVGHQNVVEVLLAQKGIDVNLQNGKDWTPLRAALGSDNPDAAELLAEDRRVIATKEFHVNWNPLCHASVSGYTQVVKLLLQRVEIHHELDLQDGDGMTALYSASANGHIRVVKCLLGAGASVSQESKGYLMPLYGAANGGHSRIVEILLREGAPADPRTHEGDSALDAAVKGGFAPVADLLMDSISGTLDWEKLGLEEIERGGPLFHQVVYGLGAPKSNTGSQASSVGPA